VVGPRLRKRTRFRSCGDKLHVVRRILSSGPAFLVGADAEAEELFGVWTAGLGGQSEGEEEDGALSWFYYCGLPAVQQQPPGGVKRICMNKPFWM